LPAVTEGVESMNRSPVATAAVAVMLAFLATSGMAQAGLGDTHFDWEAVGQSVFSSNCAAFWLDTHDSPAGDVPLTGDPAHLRQIPIERR
jgi:hypothetical protein